MIAEDAPPPQDPPPCVSIVVPVYDEAGAAPALAREIAGVFAGTPFEMIFVDDASRDDTRARLVALGGEAPHLRVLAHERNAGQSRAIRTGVTAARAPLIVMLDGDGQNDPADAPRLLAALQAAPADLVMIGGERVDRRDGASKRWASLWANALRRRLLDDGAVDTGCGLKVFRREAYLNLPYFDHQHRYLPALMIREGYRVAFAPVSHRARSSGRSKYTNVQRLAAAATDLLGVMWLRSRARRPGRIEEC